MTPDLDLAIGGMIDAISETRAPIADAIIDALHAVPRHRFVPHVGVALTETGPRLIDRDSDPEAWWATVYGPSAIVTQLDMGATDIRAVEGHYTSSNSSPGTVVDLLTQLHPEPGHRVLEVGTGTGWTAALLAHLVGDASRVTSVEVDPAVAEQAAKNLAAAGVHPNLVVGDGADGRPEGAPYDRVHVTCAVHTVPYAWVEQCRPGAVIVTPYSPGFDADHSLRLVTTPDGSAIGRFPCDTRYMMMRSQNVTTPGDPDDGSGRRFTTDLDPRTITYAPAGADLVISALTGSCMRLDDDDRMFLLDPGDPGRWGVAIYEPDGESWVYELGDRHLWEEVTRAYFQWVSWGEPGLERFGMSVDREGQQLWLDAPQAPIGPRRKPA
ncbi:methyltransferase domain-containing protein [Nonomuraea wenchangensis]|uniref:Protein-L-isoaspartate O-methyltransferase n=1 Tax=Nonomuraea wenchangensis TaxID=568860 RepID=A0A1I0LIW0_9ACTN|nr:methyltransferase domain-containing protein [Nonomuraea wenchangensis]SEU39247.1 protein-L-isoaspartate(D-aspartate) O-methyltransferase [Nonomuraea wenchangensis]